MEMIFKKQKLALLNELMANKPELSFTKKLAVVGVQVYIHVYGDKERTTSDFFEYYFKDFPPLQKDPDVVIHYFIPDGEYQLPTHPYWNEDAEDFQIEHKIDRKLIFQRDFCGYQDLRTKEFFATGPTLTQGCCDSTDNLIQYALGAHLIPHNILPLHAATVVKNNKAYVFFGVSGAGKSTLASQSYELDRLKIMSGDQIFLKQSESGLIAYANTTTIFGFHRDHPAWEPKPYPVQSVIHLLNSPRTYHFKSLSFKDLMPCLLRETVSWKEVVDPQGLLELVLKIGQNKEIKWGEMSYQKNESFWTRLLEEL